MTPFVPGLLTPRMPRTLHGAGAWYHRGHLFANAKRVVIGHGAKQSGGAAAAVAPACAAAADRDRPSRSGVEIGNATMPQCENATMGYCAAVRLPPKGIRCWHQLPFSRGHWAFRVGYAAVKMTPRAGHLLSVEKKATPLLDPLCSGTGAPLFYSSKTGLRPLQDRRPTVSQPSPGFSLTSDEELAHNWGIAGCPASLLLDARSTRVARRDWCAGCHELPCRSVEMGCGRGRPWRG